MVLRKNLFMFFLTLVSFVFLMLSSMVLFLGNNWTIGITTLEGDENLIKGLQITGVLGDSYKSFEFNISGGKRGIKPLYGKRNKIIRQYQFFTAFAGNYYDTLYYNVILEKEIWHEMSFGSTKGYRREPKDFIKISKKKDRFGEIIESMVLGVDIVPQKQVHTWAGTIILQNTLKVMELIDDKLYFVVPSDENFSGNSGIYEISLFDKARQNDFSYGSGFETLSKNGYRKLADIDLEKGNVQVKGLFGNEDKLYIVMIVQDNLRINVFSLKDNKFIDEISIYTGETILEAII